MWMALNEEFVRGLVALNQGATEDSRGEPSMPAEEFGLTLIRRDQQMRGLLSPCHPVRHYQPFQIPLGCHSSSEMVEQPSGSISGPSGY